jgi:hypothetical protein
MPVGVARSSVIEQKTFIVVISTSTSSINLKSLAVSRGYSSGNCLFVINSGVTISGSTPLTDGTWSSGVILALINNGNVYANGGAGGGGGTAAPPGNGAGGAQGGTAIYTRTTMKITNNANIGGGQGGQGGGGGTYIDASDGAKIPTCNTSYAANGATGATGTPGAGTAGPSGANGSFGDCYYGSGTTLGGPGGGAGNCIDGDSHVTWIATGTRNGPRVN